MNSLVQLSTVLVLTAIFIGGNIAVEYWRRKTDNPLTQPLSDYLTGPYGWIQSIAYLCFAAAMPLLALYSHGSEIVFNSFLVGGIALVGVVLTKWVQRRATGSLYDNIEHLHVLCAGLAFGGCTVGLWLNVGIFTPLGWLVSVAPLTTLALTFGWPSIEQWLVKTFDCNPEELSASTLQEKNYTAWLLAAFIAVAVYVSRGQP
ncbi:MAG: hypothetical protein WBR29_03340 [Gammaproteobacteria bacterium]